MNLLADIKIISPFKNKLWIDFISNHPNATIFHHPQWLTILNNQYKFKTFAICLFNKNKIIAGIPFCETKSLKNNKKWVSLPFTDICPPLYTNESEILRILNFLIEEKKKKKISSVEIRYKLPEQSNFFQNLNFSIHSTSLKNKEKELYNSFKITQVQQPIQKAIKEGLIAEVRKDISAVDEFYKLHLLTRKKLGVPIQPKNYFKNLKKIFEQNLGFIILVKKENLIISAGIFLGFSKTIIFKYGASHPKYLKLRPNNLMLWEAMLEGKKRGFELFDFGRTEISNIGLTKFKSGWGSKEEKLYYSYSPKTNENRIFNFINLKIISPLIKNSPKFICRLIGELFYKFMG